VPLARRDTVPTADVVDKRSMLGREIHSPN
jgi:hypothetical protein